MLQWCADCADQVAEQVLNRFCAKEVSACSCESRHFGEVAVRQNVRTPDAWGRTESHIPYFHPRHRNATFVPRSHISITKHDAKKHGNNVPSNKVSGHGNESVARVWNCTKHFFFSFLSKHLFVLLAQMSEGRCKKKKKCAFLGVVSDVGPLLCCLLEV